jgi:hypothetical protein
MIGMGRRGWAGYLAGKAVALSLAAIVAAFILNRVALPKLAETLHEMHKQPTPFIAFGLQHHGLLPFLPVPGLILGIAAFVLRPLRSLLAPLALLAAVLATGVIVAMLLGSMAPLYEVPRDLRI